MDRGRITKRTLEIVSVLRQVVVLRLSTSLAVQVLLEGRSCDRVLRFVGQSRRGLLF